MLYFEYKDGLMRVVLEGTGRLSHGRKKRFYCSFIFVVPHSLYCPFIVIFISEARLKQKLGHCRLRKLMTV